MPGYDSKLSINVNTPFSKYPTPKFRLGARARVQGRHLQCCTRAPSWELGPCVNTFGVGWLALYPQFRNSERVLGLLNMNIQCFRFGTVCLNSAPFNAGARARVPGHQMWTLPIYNNCLEGLSSIKMQNQNSRYLRYEWMDCKKNAPDHRRFDLRSCAVSNFPVYKLNIQIWTSVLTFGQ